MFSQKKQVFTNEQVSPITMFSSKTIVFTQKKYFHQKQYLLQKPCFCQNHVFTKNHAFYKNTHFHNNNNKMKCQQIFFTKTKTIFLVQKGFKWLKVAQTIKNGQFWSKMIILILNSMEWPIYQV